MRRGTGSALRGDSSPFDPNDVDPLDSEGGADDRELKEDVAELARPRIRELGHAEQGHDQEDGGPEATQDVAVAP